MQVFAPDLVLPLSEAGEGRERKFKIAALRDGPAWSQRDWLQATEEQFVVFAYDVSLSVDQSKQATSQYLAQVKEKAGPHRYLFLPFAERPGEAADDFAEAKQKMEKNEQSATVVVRGFICVSSSRSM